MKKFFSLALLVLVFSSCLDYNMSEEEIIIVTPDPEGVVFKANNVASLAGDTIYGSTTAEMLFLATKNNVIVPIQIDFGDGSINNGSQLLYRYKNPGIYQMKVTLVNTSETLTRIVKIGSPSVVASGETIIQLSGVTVGDSASINILCRKDKIYNHKTPGKYYLKGDMNNWKSFYQATDTNYVYNGISYLSFTFKVKNGERTGFGYYKVGYNSGEHWSYDPDNQYWDKGRGVYSVYVSGGQIYKNEVNADTPGSFGDASSQKFGATFRGHYEVGGVSDSLILYVNKNYLNGGNNMGVAYSVNGTASVYKKLRPIENSAFSFVKIPVNKNSSLTWKSYKNITTLEIGDMTSSIFYQTAGYCYLNIAGSAAIKKL